MDEIQTDAPATKGRRVVVDPAASTSTGEESSAPKRRTRSAKPKDEAGDKPASAEASEGKAEKPAKSEGEGGSNKQERGERQERGDRDDERGGIS